MRKKIAILCVALIVSATVAVISIISNAAWKEIKIDLQPNYNELFSAEKLKEKGHVSELSEYATDVSIAYQNKDGTKTLYVYSAPIRFLNSAGQYSMIDTRIANVRDAAMRRKGYIYTIANSDIKSFFPKELNETTGIIVKNDTEFEFGIYGEGQKGWYKDFQNFLAEPQDGIHYYDCFDNTTTLSFYPSHLGVNCEIAFEESFKNNRIDFWFHMDPSMLLKVEPGGYITMNQVEIDENGDESISVKGVIQKPLLKTDDGSVVFSNTLDFENEGEGKYKLSFYLDNGIELKGSTAFIAFELRREKQPDNAIYSNYPDLEYAYLRNYSVIGNSKEYGVGRLFIRYKFAKYFDLNPLNIKAAYYNISSLKINGEKYELLSVLEDWCSITGNWNKNYKTGDVVSSARGINNRLSFDITSEMIKWAEDASGQMEHNGVLLKQENESINMYSVFLSNDNTLYRNYTEVTLYD